MAQQGKRETAVMNMAVDKSAHVAADAAVVGAEGRERVALGGAAVNGAVARGMVLIAPWGQVHSASGDFVMDAESGRLTMEAFAAHGTDVPIDYEHQSLGGKYASPTGLAPAAGWIRSLKMVEESCQLSAFSYQPEGKDQQGGGATSEQTVPVANSSVNLQPGLYAEVEWTEMAQAKLAAREYRYLSPVVIVRKRDRRVVALHSAALTNKPAIVGMRPIVNAASCQLSAISSQPEEEDRLGTCLASPSTLRLK